MLTVPRLVQKSKSSHTVLCNPLPFQYASQTWTTTAATSAIPKCFFGFVKLFFNTHILKQPACMPPLVDEHRRITRKKHRLVAMDSPSRDLRMRGSPVSREAASCAPDKADLTDGIVAS